MMAVLTSPQIIKLLPSSSHVYGQIQQNININVTELMVNVNRTTSAPISVLCYDVDKGPDFVPEFNIYPSLISHEIRRQEFNNVFCCCCEDVYSILKQQ